MEFVRSAKKHSSLLSEGIYVALNGGLALALLYLVNLFPGVPILAYLLVVLSKWRILAVRPRFWWVNFQSNLLDMLLGLSVVTLLAEARGVLILQLIITVLYVIWLIVLKPMTKRAAVISQAGLTQFFAITALFSVAITWPSWLVTASMWAIGYIVVRHALTVFEEPDAPLFSLIWGLIVAELGWLAYHWTVAYGLIGSGQAVKIPQVAIIVSLLGLVVFRLYVAYADKKRPRIGSVIWPAAASGAIILFILVFFNGSNPSGV